MSSLFLFIRLEFKIVFVPFYKTQFIMFFVLIIFRLKTFLIKRRKHIDKPLKEIEALMIIIV